jgi:hypothetical protein
MEMIHTTSPESNADPPFFAAPKCKTPEKVPQEWCFKQFHNMCRNSRKKNATIVAKYGGGGCQVWQLLEKGYLIPSGRDHD